MDTTVDVLTDLLTQPTFGSKTPSKTVRVLIVDDHQVVREGLRRMLEMERAIKIVGEAVDGEDAVRKAVGLVPDVVVMDLKMPRMDGIAATREIKKAVPCVNVLVLTLYSEDYINEAIEAGASGYLLKDCDSEQITRAVFQVCDGLCPIAPSLTRDLVARFTSISRTNSDPVLTHRQRNILKYTAEGVAGDEIAALLSISRSTLKREIYQILQKLNVNDRAQAVSEAIKRKIISP
jgi:two-component system NarL family response regulator